MGNTVNVGDSLIITVFSMVVVFTGLIVLAILISVLKNIGGKKEVQVTKEPTVSNRAKEPVVDEVKETTVNDEELIAVIAAAVAASLGVSIPEVNIRSIRRIPQNSPTWSTAGRQEQIYTKL